MCKHVLRSSLSKQKVFLAIDNVSDDHESMKHAKMFLEVPYHKESLMIVTTRSKSILERLEIDGDACVEMPELEEVDAMKLFLYHAAHGKEFLEDEDKGHIRKCIQRCYFSKGVGLGSHYHPLALEALGLQLGFHGGNPSKWVKNLPRIRSFSSLSRTNPVFDILRSNFDLLPSSEQNLFMDVALFAQLFFSWFNGRIKWLCDMYKEDEDEIQDRLVNLKQKGLLQDVDLKTGKIYMHDLYNEFVELEAKGSLKKSRDLRKRKWVYVDNDDFTELEKTPEGRCWPKLVRLAIKQRYSWDEDGCEIIGEIASLEGIQWNLFSNVEVLCLKGFRLGGGTLNLEGLMGLRVLHLDYIRELTSLEGLAKLKNLVQFEWTSGTEDSHLVGQLPSSLKTLYIDGECTVLGSNLLVQCWNLSELYLVGVVVSELDFSNCRSLERMSIYHVEKLQTLSSLLVYQPSTSKSLAIKECKNLVDILGMDHLIGLKELTLKYCPLLEEPSLTTLTELRDLDLNLGSKGVQSLVVDAQDSIPRQLREFCCSFGQSMVGLNLDGFNQLEVLKLEWSSGLMSMEGVENLPALRSLDLSFCKHLLQLPNLSKSKNLEKLDLTCCFALKLHEKDIQMLSKLPLLQPVPFSGKDDIWKFRLDFVRRKTLVHSCKESHWGPVLGSDWQTCKWEESDWGAPPLQIV